MQGSSFSLKNIAGTPGALLFLYIGLLVMVVGLHFSFAGSVSA